MSFVFDQPTSPYLFSLIPPSTNEDSTSFTHTADENTPSTDIDTDSNSIPEMDNNDILSSSSSEGSGVVPQVVDLSLPSARVQRVRVSGTSNANKQTRTSAQHTHTRRHLSLAVTSFVLDVCAHRTALAPHPPSVALALMMLLQMHSRSPLHSDDKRDRENENEKDGEIKSGEESERMKEEENENQLVQERDTHRENENELQEEKENNADIHSSASPVTHRHAFSLSDLCVDAPAEDISVCACSERRNVLSRRLLRALFVCAFGSEQSTLAHSLSSAQLCALTNAVLADDEQHKAPHTHKRLLKTLREKGTSWCYPSLLHLLNDILRSLYASLLPTLPLS